MKESVFSQFGKLIKESGVIGQVTVKSVLESLNWIIGFYFLFFFGMNFTKLDTWLKISLFVILVVLIIFYLCCYIYFMLKNPDYLRSETFQLRKYQMEMLGAKNQEAPIQVIEGEEIIKAPKQLKSVKGKVDNSI